MGYTPIPNPDHPPHDSRTCLIVLMFDPPLSQKPPANKFHIQDASAPQVGLFEECGSECQMVGLPCNGSCPSGTFICGEVKLVASEILKLFLDLRSARMIPNKTSTGIAKESARFKRIKKKNFL